MNGRKTITLDVEYAPYIPRVPKQMDALYKQACANDGITVDYWRDIWLGQMRANHQKYGPFKDHSIAKFFGQYEYKPVIVVGSGPSLKQNGHLLKDRGNIPVISCLHNFHFFKDLGIPIDFWVSLDAGKITVSEISEGGTKTPEEYFEMTKGEKLLCFCGSHPDLLEKWQGEKYFFAAPVPDQKYMDGLAAIEPFYTYVSTGGNVLGACTYIAKGLMGAGTIIFMGADFSFSYDNKFHPWDSQYDANLGQVINVVDTYQMPRKSWQSYWNFKNWFDWLCSIPNLGTWINCTEGGCLGAYPEGNIVQIQQMDLKDCIRMYNMYQELKEQCEQPEKVHQKLMF